MEKPGQIEYFTWGHILKACEASVFNQVATEVAAAMLESVLLLGPRFVTMNSEVSDKLLNISGLQFPFL